MRPCVDIDILNPEAAEAAEALIRERYEERGYILVRIGLAPKRAVLFRTDEPFKKIQVILIAPNGPNGKDEKIEFLGDGQQLACFGIHPDTKQPYSWHGGEPGAIAREDLPYIREEEARQLVDEIVELLIRDCGYTHAPERPKARRKGNGAERDSAGAAADWQYLFDNIRNGHALYDSLRDLAAKLIASGMSAGAAVKQLRALMESSATPHDERWRESFDDIPRLVESAEQLKGQQDDQARRPPGTHGEAQHRKAKIRIITGEIARIVDEAEAALLAVANVVPIMVRAGMLVRPIIDRLPASHERMTDVTLLKPLTNANMIYLLNKHATDFEQYNGRSKKWQNVDPPANVATQLLQKGQWRFPKVAGVITAPTLRPDGSIFDRPGYDPTTQLWYAPDGALTMPPCKKNPSREDAGQALALFDNLLSGFPFVSDVDCSVALTSLLTSVLRGAFDVAPMHLFRARDVGSGKSLLADLMSTVARGLPCPVITFVKSIEEMEKRLGALVLEGVPIISLDNCSGDIGGDLLCQMTERPLVRIRILGKSEAPECEWRGVVFGTGNNITLAGDMTRRGLIANLDPQCERPELRTFSFDPIQRVLNDRGAYIAAAITIARAYIAAGYPGVCKTPLGSYDEWSKIVRSPLIWLGRADPVDSMEEARQEDPGRRALHNLIELWRDYLALNTAYTASELVFRANELANPISKPGEPEQKAETALLELLVQQAGTPRGDINTKTLGNWLMSVHGRVCAGMFIKLVKQSSHHGNRYALVEVTKPSTRP